MPIYEYQCTSCGLKFDALRSMRSADLPIECERCHSAETKRMLSVFLAHNSSGTITHSQKTCGSCSGGSCSICGE